MLAPRARFDHCPEPRLADSGRQNMMALMNAVTDILSVAESDPLAAQQLLPLVYQELRRIAARKMMNEPPGQTLEATALVHEAFVRLVDTERAQSWNSRGHFFAAAAEAMRRILIERARQKKSLKGGGEFQRHNLSDIAPAVSGPDLDVLALNDALDKLEQASPRTAALVKLRFFAGLTIAEAAQSLGVSTTTAENDWAYGRCWLRVELGDSPEI